MLAKYSLLRFLAVLSLVVLVVFSSETQAEVVAKIKAGFWEGGADADSTGKVTQCYLVAEHTTEHYNIFFRWEEDGLHLTLYKKNWTLEAGLSYRARVRIDRKFDSEIAVTHRKTNVIDFNFGRDQKAIDAIMAGSRIAVEGSAGKKSFPLSGTRKAIEKLIECADQYLEPSGPEPTDEPEVVAKPQEVQETVTSKDSDVQQPQTATGEMNTFKGGQAAFDSGQYTLARDRWQAAAGLGDAPSALALGKAQQDGSHIQADVEHAVQMFQQAAAAGLAEGNFLYGNALENGLGVAIDLVQARAQMLLASEAGIVSAQTRIGTYFANGIGLKQNLESAALWYETAAENGDPEAQYLLGQAYLNGHGLAFSAERAIYWTDRAAVQGFAPAQFELGRMLENGTGTERNAEEAYLWFQIAAGNGQNTAQPYLKDLEREVRRSRIDSLTQDAKLWKPEPEKHLLRKKPPVMESGPLWAVSIANINPPEDEADLECSGGFEELMSFKVPSLGGQVRDFKYSFRMDSRFFGDASGPCVHIRRHAELVGGTYENGVVQIRVNDFADGAPNPTELVYEGRLLPDGTGELFNVELPDTALVMTSQEVR